MRALLEDQKARKLSVGIEADITGTNPAFDTRGEGLVDRNYKIIGNPWFNEGEEERDIRRRSSSLSL
jgi:hypothetical protein